MSYVIELKERTAGQEIISLTEAKLNAKIDFDVEDEVLQLFLDSNENEIENYTECIFLERDVEIGVSAWDLSVDNLPVGPVSAIVEIKYIDKDGDEQTLVDGTDYKLHSFNSGKGQRILYLLEDMPSVKLTKKIPYPITITVTAGFTTATMPAEIKRAALLMFASADTYREDMPMKSNRSALSVLRPWRRYK